MRNGLIVVAVAAITSLVAPLTALADGPVGCPANVCGVGAVDPGHGGGGGSGGGGGGGSGGGRGSAPACTEVPVSPQPEASSPWWGGHKAAEGVVVVWKCTDGSEPVVLVPHFVAKGVAAGPPPPVDPAVLAQQAYDQIPRSAPVMRWGPDATHVAARYWLYLWLDNLQPAPVTVTAGVVSVTATARIRAVTWSMGAPVDTEHMDELAAPVTCQGVGSAPPADVNTTMTPAQGSCAFMYQVRSTPDRTAGAGTWPVTASANWEIDWTTTAGPQAGRTGVFQAPAMTSTTALCVGAWSTVMVAQGYTPPQGTCNGH